MEETIALVITLISGFGTIFYQLIRIERRLTKLECHIGLGCKEEDKYG